MYLLCKSLKMVIKYNFFVAISHQITKNSYLCNAIWCRIFVKVYILI